MKLDEIRIGERFRKDLGDIKGLADSIRSTGLIQAVSVTPENLLIGGQRRIEAVRLLGWEEIPVRVIDVPDLLSAQRDENEVRENLTPTDAEAAGKRIEELERPKALERSRQAAQRTAAAKRGEVAPLGSREARDPSSIRHGREVTEIAARAVGMGREKYVKAKEVVAAAEADPEKFGDLPTQMDETGNVAGAHREMVRRQGNGGRHPVHKKAHYPKPNREMERILATLDAACSVAARIDVSQLDPKKRLLWAEQLGSHLTALRQVKKGLLNG